MVCLRRFYKLRIYTSSEVFNLPNAGFSPKITVYVRSHLPGAWDRETGICSVERGRLDEDSARTRASEGG